MVFDWVVCLGWLVFFSFCDTWVERADSVAEAVSGPAIAVGITPKAKAVGRGVIRSSSVRAKAMGSHPLLHQSAVPHP